MLNVRRRVMGGCRVVRVMQILHGVDVHGDLRICYGEELSRRKGFFLQQCLFSPDDIFSGIPLKHFDFCREKNDFLFKQLVKKFVDPKLKLSFSFFFGFYYFMPTTTTT